ncbi:hypothetical protein ABEB36_011010 [Hypothenemus hampei]|uniref:Uncharacterized protein n=1 Tax=Hypothenemus hampei TaxID=57062 RepID=A0ABD1EDV9_HYPHA
MKKRKSHGEFTLTREFSDEKFKNYFRLNRNQFKEVHDLIKNEIVTEGCNATRVIESEEKLAIFLRITINSCLNRRVILTQILPRRRRLDQNKFWREPSVVAKPWHDFDDKVWRRGTVFPPIWWRRLIFSKLLWGGHP